MSAGGLQCAPHRVSCAEIWGGTRFVDTDVCTRGLSASIYSKASDSESGGDVYYFSVCGTDNLTRMVIADMRGHGAGAARLSEWLYRCVQDRMNSLDGGGLLADLNGIVNEEGFHAMTTAVVASYYVRDGCLYCSYAGHPPMLVRRSGGAWELLDLDGPLATGAANVPLGSVKNARYDQQSIALSRGDRFLLLTDGLLECPDATGEFFGYERLQAALDAAGDVPLHELKNAIRCALNGHAQEHLDHDDCTFIVAEVL